MKKRYVMSGIGLAVTGAVLLSGCSSTVTAQVPDVIQVQNVDGQRDGTITVESREVVEVVPDMARIVLSVRTEAEDAADCQQKNTEKLNQLLSYLKGLGYEDSSIKTSGFSLDPQYDWSGDKRELIGYEMETDVTVTDIPVTELGAILSDGVASGANEIQSVEYFSSGYDDAYAEALTKAVELAKKKAEALAGADGKTVGEVLSVEEYGDYQTGRYVSASLNSGMEYAEEEAADTGAAAMSVMPGEMQVSAEISVIFSMEP